MRVSPSRVIPDSTEVHQGLTDAMPSAGWWWDSTCTWGSEPLLVSLLGHFALAGPRTRAVLGKNRPIRSLLFGSRPRYLYSTNKAKNDTGGTNNSLYINILFVKNHHHSAKSGLSTPNWYYIDGSG